MSDVKYQLQISTTVGDIRDLYSVNGNTEDQSSARVFRNVQELATGELALDTGDIVVPSMCVFVNLSETNDIVIGGLSPSALPATSKLRIAGDGTPHLQNSGNLLWYPFGIEGIEGDISMLIGQDGVVLPASDGVFSPFIKLKPLEKHMFRPAVGIGEIYAASSSGTSDLFYIMYDE